MSVPLTDDAFEAILGLAASAPSSPQHDHAPKHRPPHRMSEMRVAIWDKRSHIKTSGEEAPTAEELIAFLVAHDSSRVYAGGASPPAPTPSVAYPSGVKTAVALSTSTNVVEAQLTSTAKRARTNAEDDVEAQQPASQRTRHAVEPPLEPGFILQTEERQAEAWANGGATKVLLAMQAHPADAELQADACQALTFLAQYTPEYKRRVCAAGGAVAIVRALETHGAVAAVALQGCGALAVLTMDSRARTTVREAGGAGALLRAMRLHSGTARLQQLGCTAIASLAEMHVLPVEPLATAALAAMQGFPAKATLQAQGCRTLLNLATSLPHKRAVCNAGGAGAVVFAMLAHDGEAQVQQWGCAALSALADGDELCHRAVCNTACSLGAAQLPGGATARGGVHAILHAMAKHPAHVQVAQLGCATLAALLAGAGGTSAAQCAAAAHELVSFGGVALTVQAMERHRQQWSVQLQGCAMLTFLAGLNPDGAAAARAAAGAPAALEALRVHAAQPEVVRWGSRVLRALPHPHVSAAAAATAAAHARTLRLSRAMLGSWRLAEHSADGKMPLDLVSKIASLACTAEFDVRPTRDLCAMGP